MSNLPYNIIVSHMIRNTKNFDGSYKAAWENCFQWTYFEQGAVFRNVAHNLIAIEMTTLWLSWYNGGNQRDAIANIHDGYKGCKLSETVASNIEDDIWHLLSDLYTRAYSTYLDKTYNIPKLFMKRVTVDEYNRFIGIVASTFTPNPHYDFVSNSGVMLRVHDDYDLIVDI